VTMGFSQSTTTIFAGGGDCLSQGLSLALRTFSPSVGDISGDVLQGLRGKRATIGIR
jgi:hypothetical protein